LIANAVRFTPRPVATLIGEVFTRRVRDLCYQHRNHTGTLKKYKLVLLFQTVFFCEYFPKINEKNNKFRSWTFKFTKLRIKQINWFYSISTSNFQIPFFACFFHNFKKRRHKIRLKKNAEQLTANDLISDLRPTSRCLRLRRDINFFENFRTNSSRSSNHLEIFQFFFFRKKRQQKTIISFSTKLQIASKNNKYEINRYLRKFKMFHQKCWKFGSYINVSDHELHIILKLRNLEIGDV